MVLSCGATAFGLLWLALALDSGAIKTALLPMAL
ncbi:hypothetical protein PSYMO_38438, partial [Pseudomonas amygdali pv. mori str. 301020]